MVGVPGKSKGCSTCRRRKKGCDQKRPICGQCSASGYVCGGYQRDLTFVLHPASKAVEKAVFLPTKPRPLHLTTTQSLERSAIVSQCQSLFFEIYLPHGRCMVNDQFILKCGRPTNWTSLMHSFTPNETSLELAFAALTVSRVGRNRGDARLIKESTKFYGKALKTLQKALYDPSRMRSEQVLTACLLLGLYETFEGAGGKSVGWVSHAQGAARIVELRGPERHAEQPAHLLFLGTRLPITYSAILRRKKTFLSDEDWLTVPWRKEPKTGLDRLVDIACQVPALLEQFDAVRSQVPSTNQRQGLQSCLSFCRHLQKSFMTWCTIRRPNSEAISVEYEPTGPDDTFPFTHELTYENHLFLNANLIHWSAALVISTTISEIEFLLASLGFQSTAMLSSTASAIQEAQQYAKKIVQSIPYCLWPDMGDVGIDYIQFPMCLAFQFFMKSNDSRVCSWILEMANQMQNRGSPGNSPSEGSPTGDIGLTMFGASSSAFGSEASGSRLNPNTPNSSEQIPVCVAAVSSIIAGRTETSYSAPTAGLIDPRSDVFSSARTTIAPEFDADYDLDSEDEADSPQSNDSGPQTVSSSAHGSNSRLIGSRGSGMINRLSVDLGDFTFVQENPAKYYIDRSGTDVAE